MKRTIRRYAPPARYTPTQLSLAKLTDLETDLRCAIRDGLIEYAEALRLEISSLCKLCGEPRSLDGVCGRCATDDQRY